MILHNRNSNILLLVIFFFAAHASTAQTGFALIGGMQAVSVNYKVRDIKQTTSFKPGFIIGASYKIEFEKNIFFSPAVFYSYKGYKVTLDQSAYPPDVEAIKNNVAVHTLELAPMLEYDFSLSAKHFFIKAGPSLDIQLHGKEKVTLINETTVSRTMKYGFAEYGRYAGSVILQFGYKFSKDCFVQAYYSHGLANLNNADNGPNIKYRIAGMSFGRYF
jgi:hypothetical protein